jgi:hypothetical protein
MILDVPETSPQISHPRATVENDLRTVAAVQLVVVLSAISGDGQAVQVEADAVSYAASYARTRAVFTWMR